MAQEGHAPSRGPANTLFLLGQGLCPQCRGELQSTRGGRYTCRECQAIYPVAGGAA